MFFVFDTGASPIQRSFFRRRGVHGLASDVQSKHYERGGPLKAKSCFASSESKQGVESQGGFVKGRGRMNEYAGRPKPVAIDHIKGVKVTQVLPPARELENTKGINE